MGRTLLYLVSLFESCSRFVMLRNCSGFYSYGIYEHLKEWPPFNLPQTRIVFKLKKDKYLYVLRTKNSLIIVIQKKKKRECVN